MQATAQSLERRILGDIPLTRQIGVRVASYDGEALTLAAPLGPNSNHKGTAFGGSLFSLAVLAGWGVLTLKLAEHNAAGDIVIQDSEVRYRSPVTGDFTARAQAPAATEIERLLRMLKRHGRGRVRLRSVIEQAGKVAVEFEGTFAVAR